MKANRILEMEKYITLKGTASIEELQRQFDVSANTVRRDIAELLQRGAAEKVYGGVRARPARPNLILNVFSRGASRPSQSSPGSSCHREAR